MSTPQSPQRLFNGLTDEDLPQPNYGGILDAHYSHEISGKMRVPKRIRATGEYSDEDLLLSNQNGIMNSWNYSDKIDMHVPDRIVVIGQNQHLGTRSAPREIDLENSVLPKDPPGLIRVATPPRVITLSDHLFPAASDETIKDYISSNGYNNNNNNEYDDSATADYVRAMNSNNAAIGFTPNDSSSVESDSERRLTTGSLTKRSLNYNNDQTLMARDGTPQLGDLSPSEEVLHLRRQLAKLNRRVLSIEIDNVQRQQREKIIYCLGLAYFLLKTIFWLNKN